MTDEDVFHHPDTIRFSLDDPSYGWVVQWMVDQQIYRQWEEDKYAELNEPDYEPDFLGELGKSDFSLYDFSLYEDGTDPFHDMFPKDASHTTRE